jgi:hypothetical protein
MMAAGASLHPRGIRFACTRVRTLSGKWGPHLIPVKYSGILDVTGVEHPFTHD